MSSPRPRVSALVVTYNSATTVAACLASLREEARRVPLETIVADSASADRTTARVAREFPEARLVRLIDNRGFAAAANAAARIARGDWLLLLNPDAELRPRAVAELVQALERHPDAAVAGPRIVRPDGRLELSDGAMVGLGAEARRKLLNLLHDARLPVVRRLIERRSRRPRRVDWVSGACLMLRRDLWVELGGLDEAFFLYLEDVDLCARARAAGHEVLYWPHAEAVHRGGASAATSPERTRIEYRRSQLHFYRKHGGEEALRWLRLYLEARLALEELAAWAGRRPEAARLAGRVLRAVRAFPGPPPE